MKCRGFFYNLLGAVVLAGMGFIFTVSAAQAAPAAPVDIPLTQPDGSTFTARQWGDEWQHGMQTPDGYTIIQDEQSKFWVYAVVRDGQLSSALPGSQPRVVGRDAPQGLTPHARPDLPPGSPALQGNPRSDMLLAGKNSGTQRLLFIVVNYANVKRTYPIASFAAKAFGATGSIRDFYNQASFGQLMIAPAGETQGSVNDGVIEVTLAGDHPNNTDLSQTIAAAALKAANPYINFASFNKDADEAVTSTELHIIFIIAGYEESFCGYYCAGPAIWGHRWELALPLSLDGVKVGANSKDGDYGGYAMFGEIHGFGGSSNHIAQIGIMVHELGHDLAWPDLYDTDQSSEGVGEWSIMGSGSWNGIKYDGNSPALPDAYLKWYQGWIQPQNPFSGKTYYLYRASSSKNALLLGANQAATTWEFMSHSGSGEFWLVENRQKSGYDAGLPGCGILIWHIDETRSFENDANADEDRPLIDLEQADGMSDLYFSANRGDAGDPYPGSSANKSFGYATYPNSRFYSDATSNRSLVINTTTCSAWMKVTYSGPETPPAQPERMYFPLIP